MEVNIPFSTTDNSQNIVNYHESTPIVHKMGVDLFFIYSKGLAFWVSIRFVFMQ